MFKNLKICIMKPKTHANIFSFNAPVCYFFTGTTPFAVVLFSMLIAAVFFSCSGHRNSMAYQKELLKQDSMFSAYSEANGVLKAYSLYLDDRAVILRPNEMPIVGKDNTEQYHKAMRSDQVTMTWKPMSATLASSGDMGYTYGLVKLKSGDSIVYGTYATVWKKDKKGKWKVVLDTGNLGVGKQ